jgi:hypothetical protein
MSEEKKGFLTIEEIPSSCDEQAIIAFFSPFMSSSARAMLSDALRQAPCVLMENVRVDVGEVLVKKLRGLGAQVVFSTVDGNTRPKR